MSHLSFVVYGTPIPQGSNKAYGSRIVASNGERLRPWRSNIANAAMEAAQLNAVSCFRYPVIVRASFYFKRPKEHYRSGRFAEHLRPAAPLLPASRGYGDLDKHQRAIGDALVDAGVLDDDSLITTWRASKRFCASDSAMQTPGVVIEVHYEAGS
jgi:Holliday junction resolvase RusA-like endonuclease